MFNYTNVQAELDESTWNDAVKLKLKTVLPQTGQFALSYLSTQLSATGSQNQAQVISDLLSLEPKWYALLNSGNTDGIAEEIAQISAADSVLKNSALLAIISDIRANPNLNNKVTPDLSSVMSLIEIQHFSELPENSAIALISARLNHLIQFCDLFMELRRYVYYRSIDGMDQELLAKIENALVSNQLIIGAEPLVIASQSFQPTVQNWLRDYIDQASDTQRQAAFSISGYLSSSDPAKKLTNIEQSAITSILKLYTWLHQPIITPAEIQNYEEHREIITPTEFLSGGASKVEIESEPVQVVTTPTFQIPLQKNMDLSTVQRSGLVFDEPTNVDLDVENHKRAEEKRNQIAIQEKLEALKKRSGVEEETS